MENNEVFQLEKLYNEDYHITDDTAKQSNIMYSRIRREAEEKTKDTKCFICKQECTSFCKSHSIPSFVLSNICVEGKVFRINTIFDRPHSSSKFGLKQAGTFKLICNNCDNTLFQNYESEKALQNETSDLLLNEIALKNYLEEIAKKRIDSYFFMAISETSPKAACQVEPSILDVFEAEKNAEYTLRKIDQNDNDFYLFFSTYLDYTVPIAFQNEITLVSDLEGRIVNNIYNFSPDYQQQSINVCVFPLSKGTRIILFHKQGENRNRNFRKQFNKLTDEEKLEVINYIIFLYSEDVYVSPKVDPSVLMDSNLRDVCSSTTSYSIKTNSPNIKTNPIEETAKAFSLAKRKVIPNFLSKEYRIDI